MPMLAVHSLQRCIALGQGSRTRRLSGETPPEPRRARLSKVPCRPPPIISQSNMKARTYHPETNHDPALRKGSIPAAYLRDLPPQLLELQTCNQKGCYAVVPISSEMLTEMRKGQRLKVGFKNLKKKQITVPMSLDGFTRAYDQMDRR